MSRLSIITINYNNAAGLKKTIGSVLSQSFKDFEYLIIDGNSTDGSVDIIKENAADIDYWVSERDRGIYDAMNKGISRATGDYLMFLNSGDSLLDTSVLSLCHDQMFQFPDVDIFYGDMEIIDEAKGLKRKHAHPEQLSLVFFKDQNINHQSSLIKRSLFSEFGLYPERYKLAGDHWLYLISLVAEKIFKHINYSLVLYDLSGVSATRRGQYNIEMETMWNDLAPADLREVVAERDAYKAIMQKKLVKLAISTDKILKKIIGRS